MTNSLLIGIGFRCGCFATLINNSLISTEETILDKNFVNKCNLEERLYNYVQLEMEIEILANNVFEKSHSCLRALIWQRVLIQLFTVLMIFCVHSYRFFTIP